MTSAWHGTRRGDGRPRSRSRRLLHRLGGAWRSYWEAAALAAAAELLRRLDAPALRDMGISCAEVAGAAPGAHATPCYAFGSRRAPHCCRDPVC
jgi:hypothetical protein